MANDLELSSQLSLWNCSPHAQVLKEQFCRVTYRILITKFLVKVRIALDRETSSLTSRKIDENNLSLIKVRFDDENLQNVLMKENDSKDNQGHLSKEMFSTIL